MTLNDTNWQDKGLPSFLRASFSLGLVFRYTPTAATKAVTSRHIREWSLITGRGGGGGYKTGGGAREVLPLRKGGAEKF